jgi:hypothetical protein
MIFIPKTEQFLINPMRTYFQNIVILAHNSTITVFLNEKDLYCTREHSTNLIYAKAPGRNPNYNTPENPMAFHSSET